MSNKRVKHCTVKNENVKILKLYLKKTKLY